MLSELSSRELFVKRYRQTACVEEVLRVQRLRSEAKRGVMEADGGAQGKCLGYCWVEAGGTEKLYAGGGI
jgi:hypothetical protein